MAGHRPWLLRPLHVEQLSAGSEQPLEKHLRVSSSEYTADTEGWDCRGSPELGPPLVFCSRSALHRRSRTSGTWVFSVWLLG